MDAVLETDHDLTLARRAAPRPTVAVAPAAVPVAETAPAVPFASPFLVPPGYFGETSAVLLGMMLARGWRS